LHCFAAAPRGRVAAGGSRNGFMIKARRRAAAQTTPDRPCQRCVLQHPAGWIQQRDRQMRPTAPLVTMSRGQRAVLLRTSHNQHRGRIPAARCRPAAAAAVSNTVPIGFAHACSCGYPLARRKRRPDRISAAAT